jgi:hypothetical protein
MSFWFGFFVGFSCAGALLLIVVIIAVSKFWATLLDMAASNRARPAEPRPPKGPPDVEQPSALSVNWPSTTTWRVDG